MGRVNKLSLENDIKSLRAEEEYWKKQYNEGAITTAAYRRHIEGVNKRLVKANTALQELENKGQKRYLTDADIKNLSPVDFVNLRRVSNRPAWHYIVTYDGYGEFYCIDVVAESLEDVLRHLNRMHISVSRKTLNIVDTGHIWEFTYGGVDYQIYKVKGVIDK